MSELIDLSHLFEGGMPGFKARLPDSSTVRCTARIRPLVTHEQSRAAFAGKAVLCRFGWDRLWGEEAYFSAYPFLSRPALWHLIEGGARLVGVDTWNADDSAEAERPAHTWLLERDIFIVENLCNLAALRRRAFRFFAVPIKAKGAASMPVRAFAEVLESP